MLYWQTKPDPILTAIVDAALSECLKSRARGVSVEWPEVYPRTAEFFTPSAWWREIEKLKAANLSPRVFSITDYHWLVLFEILEQFCEAYNAGAPDAINHQGTTIREIDFEAILNVFFWDTDFLMAIEEVAGIGVAGRQQMGLNEESFSIAAGLPPHPDELAITELTEPKWLEPDDGESLFVRGCQMYPAWPK